MEEPNKITPLDEQALFRWRMKLKTNLDVPASLLNEYGLTQAAPKAPPQRPPYAQYLQSQGYEFSWGHILERSVERLIVWDFVFDRLLQRYQRAGLGLRQLQAVVFEILEVRCDCTERDTILAAASHAEWDWQVFPGGAVSAFVVAAHFTRDAEARAWVAEVLIPQVLPEVIEASIAHVESARH